MLFFIILKNRSLVLPQACQRENWASKPILHQ